MRTKPLEREEVQELIDSGALSLYKPPLLHRCQCGRVISNNKRYCNNCMNVEMAKALQAEGAG